MLYSYKIIRDFGFAPNPFHGVCTLATCKPDIRERSEEGDWVAGFGGNETPVSGKMVFLMQVNEKMTYDQYWKDGRFSNKRPVFNRKIQFCYGDNIYHHDEITGAWIQENSHHSLEDGINYINLIHDTRIDGMVISYNYWYFGDSAITLSDEFAGIIPKCRNYKKINNDELIEKLVEELEKKYEKGQNGFPFSWNKANLFERFEGERK